MAVIGGGSGVVVTAGEGRRGVKLIEFTKMQYWDLKHENDRLKSQIDEFWLALERQWEIEPREYFEKEIAGGIGFGDSPMAMAVHHMWKRDARVAEAVAAVKAEQDKKVKELIEASKMATFYVDAPIAKRRLDAALNAFRDTGDKK